MRKKLFKDAVNICESPYKSFLDNEPKASFEGDRKADSIGFCNTYH